MAFFSPIALSSSYRAWVFSKIQSNDEQSEHFIESITCKLHTSLMGLHMRSTRERKNTHSHISISLQHPHRTSISIIILSIVLWLCEHVYRGNYISHSKPLVTLIDFYWIYRHVMITVCFSCMLLTNTHTYISTATLPSQSTHSVDVCKEIACVFHLSV